MNSTAHFEGLPVARLSKTNIPLEHQFDVLKQTTAPLFEVRAMGDRATFSSAITSYLVGPLIVTQASFDEIQVTRTLPHLAPCGPDYIALQYCYSGGFHGTLASGDPLNMTGAVISIQDLAHPFRGMGQSDCFFSIMIPRHAIALHDKLYQYYPTLSLQVNSPAGRVLTQSWLTLWETLPNTSQTDAVAIAQGLIGLLNGLLGGLLSPSAGESSGGLPLTKSNQKNQVVSATEDAMKAYLQENLHLPNANANLLCESFHCSRATVYRLFKSEGGVQAYVRSQRLMRCYQALQQQLPASRKTIRDIANQWGFTDAASFSRLFRKRYGLSPSDVAAARSTARTLGVDKRADYWRESDRLRQWFEMR